MRKILSALFLLTVLASLLCWGSFGITAGAVTVTNGITGDCTWTLDGTELTISGDGPMGDYDREHLAPWGCDVTKVIIGKDVTTIGTYAFSGCSALTVITIENGAVLPEVSEDGFELNYDAAALIPSKVNAIGQYAFLNCSSLATICIPQSVTTIGDGAFLGCESLDNIVVSKNNANYCGEDGVLFNKEKTEIVCYPAGKTATTYSVADSVTTIGYSAFSNCCSLTSITIPDSVNTIGAHAFYGCEALADVWYTGANRGGISIGSDNDCLIDATWHYSTGDCYWKLDGTVLTIGGIGEMADYGNGDTLPWGYDITAVVIEEGVTDIGHSAFSDCRALLSITIPNSVTTIGDYAFAYCTSLTSVIIERDVVNSISAMSDFEFDYDSGGVTPANFLIIGDCSFAACESLTDVWYTGADRRDISIGSNNDLFANATWHYNTCKGEHTYSSACDTGCNNCAWTRKSTVKHTYDNACDATCNLCGAGRKVPDHDYADATCKAPKTCKVCGATSGSKLPHKSDAGTVTKKATCTATGTKTYKCTLCKATIKTDTIAKVAHKYDSGKVTKAATCKATGVKTYTCSVCKGTKTDTIAKSTTHTYSNNCDKSCDICGKTRTVGAHKYSHNCDTTCNYCGAKRTIKHTYTNSCDTKCDVCSATRTITHSYKTTTTKATLSKNGSIVKKCTVCGKVASNTAIKYAKTFTLSTTVYTYNGGVKTPAVTVKDSAGKTISSSNYTVTYASGRKNAGTYKVTVTMKGNYTGTKTLTFKINPAKLSSYKLSATAYTYNGKVKTPTVTVKNASGTKLTKNTHYTVTYASGRKNVGTYKVTIKGKGNYTGTKTLTFKINPAKLSSYKLSATTYTYNGKVKTPSVTVKNASGTKLTKNTHYTVTYASGRKNVGTYKVTIKGKGNYTGTKTLTFKIKPKAASVNTLTAKSKALTVKLNRSLQQSTGYQIQYSTDKSFKSYKTKTLTSYKTSTTTLSGLKAKTTYYVRVRTYKTVNGTKYYSNWSTYKYMKTK